MQNPPGPPGQPAQPPAAATSGMDKKTAALLAYLITWITGIIFLFVGKNDPDVKYHAAQSVVFFGGITVLQIAFNIVSSINGLEVIGIVGTLLGLIHFIGWIYCLYKAWTGNGARFEIPVLGGVVTPWAEQLAAKV
jgi:uncharacterized membrane protein